MGYNYICLNEVARPAGEKPPWHGARSSDVGYRFLEGLIHGMRCGILAVDRHGRLGMVNDLGREILGLTEPPRPGEPIQKALAEHPQLVQLLCESFTMTSLPNRAELELNPGAAHGKTIGFTLSMIPGEDGDPIGAAVFFKDLTPIEQKEEQERLRDRLAELGQMAASMAHEIRNPLASIEVTCSLIRRRLADDDANKKLLDKINAEVRRLDQTISASLEFVRPVALDLAHAELLPVLEEAIRVARERYDRPGIEIVPSYAPIPPFLMDREQLRLVFENLILNAIEAIPECGCVQIEADVVPASSSSSVPYGPEELDGNDPWQSFDRFAVVRVSDSGGGIASEDRDKIWYPFYSTKKDGSGVGLSTVKKIVGSHRGLIDVDTAPAGGARFTVRLPMVQLRSEVRVR